MNVVLLVEVALEKCITQLYSGRMIYKDAI